MIGAIFAKTLRESLRRPLYLATLVGIPMGLMFIFGAALTNDVEPSAEPPTVSAADKQAAQQQAATEATITNIRGYSAPPPTWTGWGSYPASEPEPEPDPEPDPEPEPEPEPWPRACWWRCR